MLRKIFRLLTIPFRVILSILCGIFISMLTVFEAFVLYPIFWAFELDMGALERFDRIFVGLESEETTFSKFLKLIWK